MGKPVKLSNELAKHLSDLKRNEGESYDSCIRRHFGLPNRKGEPQPLAHYYVVDGAKDLTVHRTKADAAGEAILREVKKGKRFTADHYPQKDKVRKVREVPA